MLKRRLNQLPHLNLTVKQNDDDEFGFNNASTNEGHLRQNGILTWFGIERAVLVK